jgi:uncharacterized damage-inducible protein DinB
MSEVSWIAEELGRAADGKAWHGPAVGEALREVTAAAAATRPIPGAHTIWELVAHMTAWAKEVDQRLQGQLHQLQGDADWPPIVTAETGCWEDAKAQLVEAHRRLRATIREFPPARLGDLVAQNAYDGRFSFYEMLHGLAQHDAYHTGQIAMLKKALAAHE